MFSKASEIKERGILGSDPAVGHLLRRLAEYSTFQPRLTEC
jgi:hypothetical protein